MTVIGKGTPSFTFAPTSGTVRHFRSPSDVIESIDSDLESTIALVSSGGITFLSPILGRLGGIICLDGTLRSHLAIVSREFEVPCLVGTELTGDLPDGTGVVLDIDTGVGLVKTAGQEDAQQEQAPDDISRKWWSYIRRVGDEIAVKDFDLTVSSAALDALIHTTFGTYNELIQLVRVDFDGDTCLYCPLIYTDAEAPMAAGREVWGWGRKMADLKFVNGGEGPGFRNDAAHDGTTRCSVTMDSPSVTDPMQDFAPGTMLPGIYGVFDWTLPQG